MTSSDLEHYSIFMRFVRFVGSVLGSPFLLRGLRGWLSPCLATFAAALAAAT